MASFLDFINKKNENYENTKRLFEGFKNEDFKKVMDLILKLLRKNINDKVYIDNAPYSLNVNGDECQSYFIYFGTKDVRALSINFKNNSKTFDPYSVTFYSEANLEKLLWSEDKDNPVKGNLDLNFMGASIVYYLPVIYHVINSKDYSLSETKIKELAGKVYDKTMKEHYHNFYIGALNYKIYENISNDRISEIFEVKSTIASRNGYNFIFEGELEDRKKEVYRKHREAYDAGDREAASKFYKEYRTILNAIKGGATSLEDLNISIKKNVKISNEDESLEKISKEFKKETQDPETAFKHMYAYVNSVVKGLQPGVILCGAPGIGKTYTVLTQLKSKGYINGQNLDIIKGKCTPRQLYLSMYTHKDKGEMIVIDDADALVGPRAPEDVINILKGALDSSTDDEGGRLVSYRVTGDLKDDEGVPVPKTMSYAGSVIVITNYSVGQLDTALRNRVFTQSLDFTTQQLLDRIKKIMPAIDPGKLSAKSKIQAYEYLTELADKGADMEISIRSFATCARIFQLGEDPENELSVDDVKFMISEQMANLSRRGGKKF
ncbi:MAG: ATP-binding protein [Erysipelotrichales bacterium]|nr:ATP-binding protein [Erysipelotrichales bacterium]